MCVCVLCVIVSIITIISKSPLCGFIDCTIHHRPTHQLTASHLQSPPNPSHTQQRERSPSVASSLASTATTTTTATTTPGLAAAGGGWGGEGAAGGQQEEGSQPQPIFGRPIYMCSSCKVRGREREGGV